MITPTCPSVVLAASLLALASASLPSAHAAHSLVSSAAVGASNNPQTFVTFEPGGSASSGTGAVVSASAGSSFTGLKRDDTEATMTFNGTATAHAQSYGLLRTAASGNVSGTYFNTNNAPYYSHYQDEEVDTWITNPNGSPTFLVAYGQAQFLDTLNYGSVPAGFKTDFWFHITGSFTGTNVYHSVYVELGSQSDSRVLYPVDGANHLWTTDKFTPMQGVDLDFRTTLLSSFTLYPEYSSEGASYSGSANFMNTVVLGGINVYDQNDNLVSGWSLTSGSGTNYPVPEPSAAFLGLAGVLGMAVRRRRA